MEKIVWLGYDLIINFFIIIIRFYVIRNWKLKIKFLRVEISCSLLKIIFVKFGYLNMYINILNKNVGYLIF